MDLSRPDQPHLAVVKVPDERLVWLGQLYKPKKVTPAELELLDLPGLDFSDESGRSRATSHRPALEQSDALLFVLRAFENTSVAPYRGRIKPEEDLEELQSEMLLADLDRLSARVEKLTAAIKKPTPQRDEQQRELKLMTRLLEALESEQPLREAVKTPAEEKSLRSFGLLSLKPALTVINCDEDQASSEMDDLGGLPTLGLSARIEEEIAQLPAEQRKEFLADLGVEDLACDRLIRAAYQKMDLVSFLTVGEDECRAWTIPAGTGAQIAAGKIHSDIARGFIRAEVVAYDDFREAGDFKGAKAAGKVRLEGKEYIVADGDIINFRFNV